MFANVRADLAHYRRFCCPGRSWLLVLPYVLLAHPASAAVLWYRFGSAVWRLKIPVVRQLLQVCYLLAMPFVRMYSGVQIQPQTVIGPGLSILHFGGVVITRECRIGRDCLLYHNVSLVTMKNRQGPTIGDSFYAGLGTTIIGDLTIEDNVTCGAGCVITRSVPKDAVVAGVPAKILRFRRSDENNAENRTLPRRVPVWMDPPEEGRPPGERETA